MHIDIAESDTTISKRHFKWIHAQLQIQMSPVLNPLYLENFANFKQNLDRRSMKNMLPSFFSKLWLRSC